MSLKEKVKHFFSASFFSICSSAVFVFVIFYITLPALESTARNGKSDSVRVAIENAYSLVNHSYKRFQNGEISEEQAMKEAKGMLQALRYNTKDYFFVSDMEYNVVAHGADPYKVGRNMKDYTDAKGVHLYQEFVKIAKDKGEGHVTYFRPKKGEKTVLEKTSYIKLFKPWGWILGTGVYVDDVLISVKEAEQSTIYGLIGAILFALILSISSTLYQYKTFIAPVKRVIGRLKNEYTELNKITNVIGSSSESIVVATNQQAMSVENMAAAMSEIKMMVDTTKNNADRSHEVANVTASISNDSRDKISNLLDSFQTIQDDNKRVVETIKSNSEHLQDISKTIAEIQDKTKIITDIVFQTKLLSFNASVEAARAGEHGRGFSVVAGEIGNLAQVSGSSAVEITDIVEKSTREVQNLSERTKASIESIIETTGLNLQTGQDLMNDCKNALEELVEQSQRSSAMSDEILRALSEQELGIHDMTDSVTSLNETQIEFKQSQQQAASQVKLLIKKSESLKKAVTTLEKIAS